jgi:hypothetical protein
MSPSCHGATFSRAAPRLPRSTWARPDSCSTLAGLGVGAAHHRHVPQLPGPAGDHALEFRGGVDQERGTDVGVVGVWAAS